VATATPSPSPPPPPPPPAVLTEQEKKIEAKLSKDKNNNMWCKGKNIIDQRRTLQLMILTKPGFVDEGDDLKRKESQTYCQSVPWSAVFFGIALSRQACPGSAATTTKPQFAETSSSWLVAPASFKSDGAPPGKQKKYSTFNDYTIKTLRGLADLVVTKAAETADCKFALESRTTCNNKLNPNSYYAQKDKDVRELVRKANTLLDKNSKYYYCGNHPYNSIFSNQAPPNDKSSLCAVPWYVGWASCFCD
jgi:hypothetical protein